MGKKSFIPGQAPGTREESETRKGFTGTVTVVAEVDFYAGTVRRRTLTYQRGLLINVSEPSDWA
jgi:hypothetical protein